MVGYKFSKVYLMERGRYSKVSVYMSLMLHQKREKSEGEYCLDGQANIGK